MLAAAASPAQKFVICMVYPALGVSPLDGKKLQALSGPSTFAPSAALTCSAVSGQRLASGAGAAPVVTSTATTSDTKGAIVFPSSAIKLRSTGNPG
jgi:hypothetical protein